MFEYHAWATIQCSAGDEDDAKRRVSVNRAKEEIKRMEGGTSQVDLRVINALFMLHMSGFSNHRATDAEDAIDVFRRIGQVAPGSYGMFYFWDDEDAHGRHNEFQVLVMRRGEVTEEADPFLSPCVPMIEDES